MRAGRGRAGRYRDNGMKRLAGVVQSNSSAARGLRTDYDMLKSLLQLLLHPVAPTRQAPAMPSNVVSVAGVVAAA